MKNLYSRSFQFSLVAIALGVTVLTSSTFLNESSAREFPDHLKLKTPKDTILGSKEFPNGDVKYAYKSNVKIDGSPSSNVLKESQKNSLIITAEQTEKRTKHSRTFSTTDSTKFVTEIIAGDPQYYQDTNGEWWEAEYATTTKEAFDDQTQPSIISRLFFFRQAFADTSTFYPDPDAETTSVDGRARAQGATWSSMHSASNGDYASASESNELCASSGLNTDYYANRGFFLFDTSSIDDSNSIDGASFSIYLTSIQNGDNDGNDFISVITTTPSSNTNIVTDDVEQVGTTEQHASSERKDVSNISTGAYTEWTLNSTGLGNISKNSITKFGLREGHDLLNDAYSGANDTSNYITCNFAETAGTNTDPKLVVTHAAPSVPVTQQYEVRRSVNLQRSSTSTLQTDSELRLGLLPNKKYIIEGVIFATSSSGIPDIQIGWGFPTGVIADLAYMSADEDSFLEAELMQTSSTTSQRIQLAVNKPAIIKISGTVSIGSASSTVSFLWSQAAANGSPTTVLRGSYLKAEEINE